MKPIIIENEGGKPFLLVTFERCVALTEDKPVPYDAVVYGYDDVYGQSQNRLDDSCLVRYSELSDLEKQMWRQDAEEEVVRLVRRQSLMTDDGEPW